jgi:hypothetical protein
LGQPNGIEAAARASTGSRTGESSRDEASSSVRRAGVRVWWRMRRCQVEKRSSTDGREDWGGSSKLSIQLSQRGSPKAKGRGKSQRRRRWWVSAGRSGRTVSGSVVATIFMSIHHGHRSAQRAGPCWFGFHGSNQEPMLAPEARQGRGRAGRGKASDPMRKECQPLGLQQAAGFWAPRRGRGWERLGLAKSWVTRNQNQTRKKTENY